MIIEGNWDIYIHLSSFFFFLKGLAQHLPGLVILLLRLEQSPNIIMKVSLHYRYEFSLLVS